MIEVEELCGEGAIGASERWGRFPLKLGGLAPVTIAPASSPLCHMLGRSWGGNGATDSGCGVGRRRLHHNNAPVSAKIITTPATTGPAMMPVFVLLLGPAVEGSEGDGIPEDAAGVNPLEAR